MLGFSFDYFKTKKTLNVVKKLPFLIKYVPDSTNV